MKRSLLEYPVAVTILYYVGTGGDMEDTLENVDSVYSALKAEGHIVRKIEVTKRNWRRVIKSPGDVFFNFVDDENYDLYYKVTEALIYMGRSVMGNGYMASKFGSKKAGLKRKMKTMGIPTPAFRIINRKNKHPQIHGLQFPLMVKPSGQHAGVGISQESVVIDGTELEERIKYLFKNFPGEVVAEEFIEGREIHVSVVGNGKHLVCLPPCEILFNGEYKDNWDVYTYEAKWDKKSWEYWSARIKSPVYLPKKVTEKIETICKKAFRVFGCSDLARFDIRLDEKNKPLIIDMNMSPSINRYDRQDATIASVEAIGWTYEEFMEKIVELAYKRVYKKLPDRIRERTYLLAAPLR
jgi:D-alanine-D-alanine ligase